MRAPLDAVGTTFTEVGNLRRALIVEKDHSLRADIDTLPTPGAEPFVNSEPFSIRGYRLYRTGLHALQPATKPRPCHTRPQTTVDRLNLSGLEEAGEVFTVLGDPLSFCNATLTQDMLE